MKKLTYSYVRESFEKEGYTLISTDYVNTKTKLYFLCNHNTIKYITWGHFKEGRRCNCNANNKKPIYSYIKSSFEKEGYTLLTTSYINNRTNLDYICNKGHKHAIMWCNWGGGHRCPTCAGQTKPTIEEISASFTKEGYTLLSTGYVNSHSHLEYVCPEGHVHKMMWTNWQQGYRCPTCYIIYNNGANASNWQGGISFEPYCAVWKDKEYKKDIRDRDGNRCLNPYCNSKNKNDLAIHHIDYNKKNCKPSNLITVCRSCNSKANTDRMWHKAWYQTILKSRYKYIYYQTLFN